MRQKSNCYYFVDFLPSRTEVMISSISDNECIYQNFNLNIENSELGVKNFLLDIGIKAVSIRCNQHRESTTYNGKAVLTDIFSEQSVRNIV
jgi:hypothetical protein